jgi:hypothetical protein
MRPGAYAATDYLDEDRENCAIGASKSDSHCFDHAAVRLGQMTLLKSWN